MKTVEVRRIGDIGIVVMNRPERKNAMNAELLNALIDELEKLESAAVVITGAGGAFSSGADLSEAADRRPGQFNRLYELVSSFPIPTVAAVNGPCIGGGAELACACDLRVGTASAVFRFPGSKLGIPVGVARLPLLVGLSHAKDLLLTARTIGADEAFRIGLLNRVVADRDLEHEAVALAAAMASAPGAAQTKRLLDDASGLSARVRTENRALSRWQRRAEPPDTQEKAPRT